MTRGLTVYCKWVPAHGFFIWGTSAQGYRWDPLEMKLNLFAWHKESFYGTFLPQIELDGVAGIKLASLPALEFFAQPPQLEFISPQWSDEIIQLQKIATMVKQNLTEENWLPDYQQWQKGQRGWKLAKPQALITDCSLPYLGEWVDQIIKGSANAAYPFLDMEKSPHDNFFIDEEDWLIAIGWKKDPTPFRTCLRLVESMAGWPWTLNIILQDKENPDLLVELPADQLIFPEETTIPASWLAFSDQPKREISKWIHQLPWLKHQENRIKTELTEDEAWEFLNNGSLQLVEAGFTVFLPVWWAKLKKLKPKLKVKTKSSVGSSPNSMLGLQQLVTYDWQIALGDVELSTEEFSQLVEDKKRLIKIRDQWIQVDPAFLQQAQKIIKDKKNRMSLGEILQMQLLSGLTGFTDSGEMALGTEESIAMEVELNDHLARMVEQLTQVSSLPLQDPPANFQGVLRNYQRTGYSWLMFLRNFGLGGCLADDMGLGKTIQFIAYLLATKGKEPVITPPALLICPTSVIGNWQMELKRFAPSLQVQLHYGPQRSKGEAFNTSIEGKDLVITSYTLAQMDEQELQSVHWHSICLDEAQNIKNAYTKQAMAIRKLTGSHKIALTGTPMENRLTELWSIMDFLNQGYLGSLTSFNRQIVNVIEKTRAADVIDRVQRLVRPFLLRRIKNDPLIELDLPDKQEFKEYVTLTVEQATLYEKVLDDMLKKIDQVSAMERRGLILATLTKLKQVCNHPALLLKEGRSGRLRNRSTKLDRLLEMVEELRSEGDRCLIFTQYVEMGHLLQEVLHQDFGEPVQFLHGGSSKAQRDAMIARFQDLSLPPEEGCGIFILSLKAGGTGLNLTAANHVFHFDRWWNPAVENQATDRAHRIGQTRHVQVHKFISLGTMEERIDEMIKHKQSLNELVIGGRENWLTELSTGDLREVFALRREWIND